MALEQKEYTWLKKETGVDDDEKWDTCIFFTSLDYITDETFKKQSAKIFHPIADRFLGS